MKHLQCPLRLLKMTLLSLTSLTVLWLANMAPARAATILTGRVTNNQFIVAYLLAIPSDQKLTASMVRVSGDLIPFLGLLDSTGKIVARAMIDSGRSASLTYTPKAGDVTNSFTLEATRQDDKDGTTTGDFVLSVDHATVNDAPMVSQLPTLTLPAVVMPNPLLDNLVLPGSITNDSYQVNYLVYLDNSQTLTLDLKRTNGDLMPLLIITDLSGTKVVKRGRSVADRASLSYKPDISDWYLVVVSRADIDLGTTQGKYSIEWSVGKL